MIRTALRVALATTALVAAQAQATSNVSFTGTITYASSSNGAGPATGETIAGAFTIGNVAAYYSSTDGSTYAYADYYGSGAGSVSGAAWTSGGSTMSISNSSTYAYQAVYRDYSGYLNEVVSEVEGYNATTSSWTYLYLYAYDYNGSSSTLFSDPNGGLSFGQAVNTAGTYVGGEYEVESADGSYYYGEFTPSTFTISSVPEPANVALLLAGVGLVGLRARRRQQAA